IQNQLLLGFHYYDVECISQHENFIDKNTLTLIFSFNGTTGGPNGGVEKDAAAAVAVATVTFTAVKPQLSVEAPKANDAVQFYKAVFGAEEVGRTMPSKLNAEEDIPLVLFAESKLAGSTIFRICALPGDCDVAAAIAKVVSAGAVAEGEIVEDKGAFGGSVGKVTDPYGFVWLISSPPKKQGTGYSTN
ncbi:uncharacterized protein At5g48480-like, partial [Humulus lupulus]|uniref:uncharacterized protein At5g48480-like n=1 Tax=Humulus lupulus TaxID=3486 RepID=UPI002B410E4A